MFKIVLLISLCDPTFQKAKSIPDLLNYFCKGDPDAIPVQLRTRGLIADILKRRVLPYCGLVVSSRPHVTEHLHKQATLKVDILGFTEKQ